MREYPKKFTKKQRHEIYKLALELFDFRSRDKQEDGFCYNFMCVRLNNSILSLHNIDIHSLDICSFLPEFNTHKPDMLHNFKLGEWFDSDVEGDEKRRKILFDCVKQTLKRNN